MLHKNKLIAKILLCVIIIQVIQPMVSISVFAETNAEQTTEEIGTEYEIKATEEWDVSKNGDRSVIAKWNRSDRSLTITGKGEMKSWEYNSTEDWHNNQYTKAIKRASIGEGVTSIGDDAFERCSSLESITIPSSVTSIEEDAFFYCSSLERITIPSSVTSIRNYTFCGCSSLESITIPEGVTRIGSLAFSGCSSLESITIPEGVMSIGQSAFSECSSLESIEIPNSVMTIMSSAFSKCSSLTSINVATNNANYKSENGILFDKGKTKIIKYPEGKTDILQYQIPENVTSIGNNAFYRCSSLESITIPSSVTSIEYKAFYGCSSLESITIPEGVTSIGASAFFECSSLESIEIPSSVTSIGENATPSTAFLYVTRNSAGHKYAEENKQGYILNEQGSIESDIEVGTEYEIKATEEWDVSKNQDKSVMAKWNRSDRSLTITGTGEMKSWRDNSKEDWHRNKYTGPIKRVSIKEGVTSIGNYAFDGCSNLESIEIPSSVTSIGDDAFYRCSGLTSINVATNNANYKSENGILFNKDKTIIIKYPEGKTEVSYQIPEGVKNIEDRTFAYCSSLQSITLSNDVEVIGNGAFWDCISLKKITIPEMVKSIGIQAFCGCSSLTSITIPDSVQTIRMGTFCNCSNLENITISSSATRIESDVFSGCRSLKSIAIPEGTTNIESTTFRGCISLTSITIPSSVTSIGNSAFFECSGLENIKIPSNVTSIDKDAFRGIGILYVTRNSAGHKYAEENKQGYIIVEYKGDVNQDGKIDTTDLTKILRHISAQNNGEIAQKHPSWILTGNEANAADINDNSKIDTTDLTKMLRHIAAQNNNEIAQNHPDWII